MRRLGFRTPIWALADSRRIADVLVSGTVGEVDGFIYLGQQTPAFYAKQIIAHVEPLPLVPATRTTRS